jgi:hypothetical protein
MNLEDMLRSQEGEFADFERQAAKIDKRIADLDPQLQPDALRKRTAQIRSEAVQLLSPWMRALSERAARAEATARTFTKEAELRRAKFHNDEGVNATMTLAAFARLQRSSTAELIEHLEDAVSTQNLALAEAVRLEFSGRPERERQELTHRYSGAFEKLQVPQVVAAKQALGKIASLAALGEERFTSLTSGRSDPVARMTAVRLAAA